jgi:NAD(P)-dependent dehydrogenase (short-subunit alcohol dehydrogenase family)
VAIKTALVTGGTAGIGYELARAPARQGWAMIITGHDAERGGAAVVALRRDGGHERVEFVPTAHSTIGANQTKGGPACAAA